MTSLVRFLSDRLREEHRLLKAASEQHSEHTAIAFAAYDHDCFECVLTPEMKPSALMRRNAIENTLVNRYQQDAERDASSSWGIAVALSHLALRWRDHPEFNDAWTNNVTGVSR